MSIRTNTARAAFEAAEISIRENKTVESVTNGINVSRSSVTVARLILEFGTPEEIAIAKTASKGMRAVGDEVRARLTTEQLKELHSRNGSWSFERKDRITQDKILWSKLGPALAHLAQLPNPHDMVGVVTRNAGREGTVKAYLANASRWLKEFKYAFETRDSKPEGNHVDTRGSDSSTGTQYPKPPTQ